MAKQDPRVDVREKTVSFRGYFQVDLYNLRHRRFDGTWSEVMSREVFERGHAAAVLPYDPMRDAVVLIEQFRVGALAAGMEPWLTEIVAGIIEPGEDPADVVRREAVEEAGCEIQNLETIGKILVSPGGCSETLTLYCGRVDSGDVGGLHGLAHEHEDIRAFTVPAGEALAKLAAGDYVNASLIMALQWLALNRETLRRKWLA